MVYQLKNMADEKQDSVPDAESLRVQLTELNNRSRFYSSQIWQLPLAYFAAVGLVLAALKESGLIIGFGAAGALGLLLLWHLTGIEDGRHRAVANLQRIERDLNLTQTAEEKPGYTRPLIIAVALAAVSFIAAAVVLWCKGVA